VPLAPLQEVASVNEQVPTEPFFYLLSFGSGSSFGGF